MEAQTIQKVDAICDCIPIVSTLTNGAQLLYKLAHKVAGASTSITPGLITELKIHALSKESYRQSFAMIPVLGNVISFIGLCAEGCKRDRLQNAIWQNDTEVVRLCLANGHLTDANAKEVFADIACWFRPDAVAINLILNHRNDWEKEDVVTGIVENISQEKCLAFLNYYEAHFPEQTLHQRHVPRFLPLIDQFAHTETAERLIRLLPRECAVQDLLICAPALRRWENFPLVWELLAHFESSPEDKLKIIKHDFFWTLNSDPEGIRATFFQRLLERYRDQEAFSETQLHELRNALAQWETSEQEARRIDRTPETLVLLPPFFSKLAILNTVFPPTAPDPAAEEQLV